MRRAVLVCFMLLLPFQWAWAAAASTCQHEAGTATSHFGHHAHQHVAAPAGACTDAEQSTPGADHADCGVCHLSAAQAVASATSQAVALTGPVRAVASAQRYLSHVPAGPERPDRIATP